MTPKQYAMLAKANGCSLPGDGLRIKGSGAHRTARALETMGYIQVAAAPKQKARVYITELGRRHRERMNTNAESLRAMGRKESER